jgi:hypothetical protein
MNTFKTSDLSLSAYLSMMGLKIIKAEKDSNNKFIFEFEDPEDLAKNYSISFLKSDFIKYDNSLRNLKRMLYLK